MTRANGKESSGEADNGLSGAIRMICQLDKVTTRKDGGSRITIDCGVESLNAVQELLKLNGSGEMNFAVFVVPLTCAEF